MSYRVISMRDRHHERKSSGTSEFYEAMEMAKEGLERVCDLAEEMIDQYGYGERRDDWDDMGGYGERRRRDSRGRYM